MKTLPSQLESVECVVAPFEKGSFGYCESISVEISMEKTRDGTTCVNYMGTGHEDFETALRTSSFRLGYYGKAQGRPYKIRIPTSRIGQCTVNWNLTEGAPPTALNSVQKQTLRNKRRKLRYPMICEGDPFYLVYLMNDKGISSIWQYAIYPELTLRWSFDSDSVQRSVPVKAMENLTKKELWYKVE
jgi:hypothetical protein